MFSGNIGICMAGKKQKLAKFELKSNVCMKTTFSFVCVLQCLIKAQCSENDFSQYEQENG